jgi:Gram-negative bacterial TonB protein C-terminal/PilZ domain
VLLVFGYPLSRMQRLLQGPLAHPSDPWAVRQSQVSVELSPFVTRIACPVAMRILVYGDYLMSTSTDHLTSLESPGERRFYPRIIPARPIYVAFGSENLCMLLNLSENGLLVSTPTGLDRNSVFRVSLRLNGLAKPIEVHVRTIWTTDSQRRAGIQLLDLSDYDREQIRKWQALEDSRGTSAEPAASQVASKPRKESNEGRQPEEKVVTPPAPSQNPVSPPIPAYLAPLPEGESLRNTHFDRLQSRHARPSKRRKRKSEALALAGWILVGAVGAVGGALFFRSDLLNTLLIRFKSSAPQTTASSASPAPFSTPNLPDPEGAKSKPAAPASTDKRAPRSAGQPSTGSPQSPMNQSVLKTHFPLASPSRPNVPTTTASSDQSAEASAASSGSNEGSTMEAANRAPVADLNKAASPATENQLSNVAPPAVTTAPANVAPASATRVPAAPAPTKSAITGSIAPDNSARSNPNDMTPTGTPATSNPSGSRSAWPTSGPPVAAGRASLFRSRSSGAVNMDTGDSRVTEITPPRGLTSSFMTLPGERVLEASGLTMHIRRSVRVPANHWIWHNHKQLVLGELTSRVDPQPARVAPGSGSVTVQASIDKDGQISDLKPVNGSFVFLPSVALALRQWRYQPTYLDGKAVETRAEIEIDFHTPGTASRR